MDHRLPDFNKEKKHDFHRLDKIWLNEQLNQWNVVHLSYDMLIIIIFKYHQGVF